VSLPPFQVVVDEHGPAVWRYLVAAAGPGEAADCFQETFLSALRAYPRLRPASNVRAWLFTIAHRKVVDGWRVRRRHAVPVRSLPDGAAGHVPPPSERDDDLWASVRALPPKQRTAVVHRFVGDLSFAEIAAVIGCSEDAARQNVHAAMTRLREEHSREPDRA